MATFINVALEGEAPRIVNLDNVLDFALWTPPNGSPGTIIRMMCADSRGDKAVPYAITVSTPFSEIIYRIRNQVLRVGQPAELPAPPPVAKQD